jgi:hypothetical protein
MFTVWSNKKNEDLKPYLNGIEHSYGGKWFANSNCGKTCFLVLEKDVVDLSFRLEEGGFSWKTLVDFEFYNSK